MVKASSSVSVSNFTMREATVSNAKSTGQKISEVPLLGHHHLSVPGKVCPLSEFQAPCIFMSTLQNMLFIRVFIHFRKLFAMAL